ncbi:MAG: response regulator transcription factor [Desulfobacula sp.]|jgi:DNA-binding NarL/FixJ family response regulator|nr:response regulator transcription factor [Desulfobacula sp.]MBT6341089.1 response regulator transcription factor [Desulfobacula sp.]MBT7261885.1 response regulator transcription factor [Desulfobacula sp.]
MKKPLNKVHKILIVDDHPIFCLGMAELINKATDLVVCGSESTAPKAWDAIKKHKPDLVIVDISLKESNGINLVEEIKQEYPDLPALVLSMYDESLYAERALVSGARGYIMKQKAIGQVVEAVRKVLAGEVYASQKIKDKVFNRLVSSGKHDDKSFLNKLTNRELEVFRLIGDGLESKEVAERLNLSIKTVGTHRENIKQKFNLKHYTELVKFAVFWSQKMKK